MLFRISISFAALLLVPAAHSGEVPFYSVEQWCNKVAHSSGARSETIYGGCIDLEQSAYDTLRNIWSPLPADTQVWCDKVARSSGTGSYKILNECVEDQETANKTNSTRQFFRR